MSTKQKALQTTVIVLSIATITTIILYYYLGSSSSDDVEDDTIDELRTNSKGKPDSQPDGRIITSKKTKSKSVPLSDAATPLINNTSAKEEKTLHAAIEELDKKGKEYFKEKKYLEAAEVFTGALDLIANYEGLKTSTSLARQISTLTNNRSAMYEKAGLFDLALIDCNTVLEQDINHQKARIRILRILESQERYGDALVQICALQLKFMQENRAQLRMGIPLQPPVSQQKLEDTVAKLIPAEVEKCMQDFSLKKDRSLPSPYTLGQLLKSFSGYNSWMSKAARFGNIATLNEAVEEASDKDAATRASCLWKRGLRHTHDKSYELAAVDFEAAYALVENDVVAQDAMVDDEYARLLEWIGMIRHWKYDLDGAREVYEKCSQLEPTNASLLVKQAGVKMDGGKHDEALELFDAALGLDPNTTDALLHRANCLLLKQKIDEAQADLTKCLNLRPDHLLACLRLATLLMAVNDIEGAKEKLKIAEQLDPLSSEVHSYRGEMHFSQGELEEAKAEFERAIDCDPTNPTPYVNLALAIMNTPPPSGGPPDTATSIQMLQKAIEVDPQMHSAYMHLGQLKLAMATDLSVAREVVKLYDVALEHCRTAEEMRDICGVRLLTQAQVDAASMLNMETFGMQ